jgi:hypothetical protein
MLEKQCSRPGCFNPAAVEVHLRTADGKMSKTIDPKCPFLCSYHCLEDGPKDRFYHWL